MKIDIPTHQMIQMKVGLKFSNGADSPQYPVAITIPSKNTEKSLIGTSKMCDVNIAWDQLVPIKLKRQYDDSPLAFTNTLMNRKERATAKPAPMRKYTRGTGNSVRSPNPWA